MVLSTRHFRIITMPEPLSVDDFINDTLEDVRDPLKANFISKVSSVRLTVHQLDEGIESDRNVLLKTKKLVKSVITSGISHADNIIALCDYFEKLGQFALESDEVNGNDIAASLCKFSVVHRDLANMSKHLMQNMNSILVFPMETFMQGDIKSDLKKPFERALKEYEYKYDKLRKEKLQLMKETGIFTPEAFTTEMTEDLEKERRKLQLETCEYLIKVNELKAKRSADLLQHLIDFYYAQSHYLRECLGVMDHFGKSMNDLASRVTVLQKIHDAQKRRLVDTREEIRTLLEKESAQAGVTYAAQPTQLNRAYGTRKSGFLLKKSDGKVKRVWQRRRVRIGDGELWLYHADESKPPVRLALLTCQVKLPVDAAAGASQAETDVSSVGTTGTDGKNHFDLVSNSRTYNFQAEDDQEYEEWISVLNNAMQEEFQRAMNGDASVVTPDFQQVSGGDSVNRNNNNATGPDFDTGQTRYPFGSSAPRAGSAGGGSLGESLPGSEHDLLDSSSPTSRSRGSRSSRLGSADALSTDITHSTAFSTELKGRAMRASIQAGLRWCCPGNAVCADCDRPDPEWVSVNLGVLICLECCGAHRELGVHCSRTQSLLMDDLSTNQLLLPRFLGNRLFNEVFESSLATGIKPKPNEASSDGSSMLQRRAFIKAKYIDRRYITSTTTSIPTMSTSKGNDSGLDDSSDATVRDPLSERFLRRDLLRAVRTGDLSTLLQVYAEKFDLMTPFQPEDDDGLGEVDGMSALHIAVQQTRSVSSDLTYSKTASQSVLSASHNNLALVEFIIQNSPSSSVQRTNHLGETVLHHGVRHGCVDALRLLLQAGGLPTPMLMMTNKAGQTALRLAEQLAETSNVDTELYKSCAELLRLAEAVLSSAPGTDPSGSVCSLFPNSEANERLLAARSALLEAVDQLQSVDWGLSDTCPKPRVTSTCRRTVSAAGSDLGVTFALGGFGRSHDSSTASPKAMPNAKHGTVEGNGDGPATDGEKSGRYMGRLHSYVSQYGHALATLPRKKGPAPRPPPTDSSGVSGGPLEFEAHYDNSPRERQRPRFGKFTSSSSTINSTKTPEDRQFTRKKPMHSVSATDSPSSLNQRHLRRTTFSVAESESSIGETPPDFASDLSRLAELMHSSLCGGMDRDIGLNSPDSKPTSPVHLNRSVPSHHSTIQSSSPLNRKLCRSNDHIDILLDVLEEKPSSCTDSSPSKSSGGTPAGSNPPPIPPKPQVFSSMLYSTLPTRSSTRNDIRLSTQRNSETNSSETKPALRSALPTTPRLPKPSLFPVQQTPFPDQSEAASSRTLTKPSDADTQVMDNNLDLDVSNSKLGDLLEAIYDCEAERPDELTFRQGEVIQLAARPDDDWWEGFVASQPWRRGMFPVTYVKRHIID